MSELDREVLLLGDELLVNRSADVGSISRASGSMNAGVGRVAAMTYPPTGRKKYGGHFNADTLFPSLPNRIKKNARLSVQEKKSIQTEKVKKKNDTVHVALYSVVRTSIILAA